MLDKCATKHFRNTFQEWCINTFFCANILRTLLRPDNGNKNENVP